MILQSILQYGFIFAIGAYLLGAVGSLLLRRNNQSSNMWGSLWALVGSAAGVIVAVPLLATKNVLTYAIPTSFPLFSIRIVIDSLAAFFVFTISIVAFLVSLYGLSYMKQFEHEYNLGSFYFFYNLFLASMLLVVTAGHALYFLIVWEIMSLASYFLVVFEHKDKDNVRSGTIYLVIMHVGYAAILLGFLVLARFTGAFHFESLRTAAPLLPELARNGAFLLFLVGFGIKAGIIPFHVWLPRAHPAAPSHVSALMSGVMIKTGIYMLIRVLFDIMPGGPPWWGMLLLLLGAISSLLGVLYALAEHDIKRLLAYHSIENIGIILLGIGSAVVFAAKGSAALAFVGIVAALYHTLNHAIFKALLFLGAGSVVSATHTRNLEDYGGLAKVMPLTALFFLVGSAAISGLPPLNGFVSEWMTFQSLFVGVGAFGGVTNMFFIFSVIALAFTSGLALACFVKAFGAIFLARPRSQHAEGAREASMNMLASMGILAALTFVLGVLSIGVTPLLEYIAYTLPSFSTTVSVVVANADGIAINHFSYLAMSGVLGSLLAATGIAALIMMLVHRRSKIVVADTWDCGYPMNPRMEITATGFSRSLITIFKGIMRPIKQADVEYHDVNIPYITLSHRVTLGIENIFEKYGYDPLWRILNSISRQVKRLQGGNLHLYVTYIVLALLGLLIWITYFGV